LIDPHERKWYDDHKSSILRGNNVGSDSNEDIKTDISNLWSYFSHTCYSGPDDGPSGFYTIYRNVFERLDDEENKENVNRTPYPIFGDSSTNSKDVLRFYSFWSNFVTVLSFSWEDQYDSRDAPNRDTRRAIDKENKKFRDKARKEYNDLVEQVYFIIGELQKEIEIKSLHSDSDSESEPDTSNDDDYKLDIRLIDIYSDEE
jgi:DnaJ family protein A protein 5